MFVNYAELLLPSNSSVCIAWSSDSYSQAHKIRLWVFLSFFKKTQQNKTNPNTQNHNKTTKQNKEDTSKWLHAFNKESLTLQRWILELHSIGSLCSHVVLIIFRSGVFCAIERDRVVRLGKRRAEDTALFSGDFRKKRLRISNKSYPGQFSVYQSSQSKFMTINQEKDQKQYLANSEKMFFL